MNPGKLKHRITILQSEEKSDGAGGYIDNWKTGEGWSEVLTTWADIRMARAREVERAQQRQAEVSHIITMRYRPNIRRSHIIKFKGRRFDIDYVINIDEGSKYLQLECLERD